MRKISSLALAGGLAAVLLVSGLQAQVPDGVKIDTPKVRVLVATEQPHHPSALHEHTMNRVMIYLGGGQMKFTEPAGTVENMPVKKGQVLWSPAAGPHISENVGGEPFQVVEIELKGKPSGSPAPVSKIDPLHVDPKHYSLELENDQVRVLRVRFGPREKGVLHEHTLEHIVVYLNDQARGKAGEVRLDGPMTHTEQNPLDHPVERIAIDLK
ncbi:MAG TPA: hypothetical protein VFA54_17385 [Bryobacterales bacterium]|nr:hypothetical protein [Bryobacterales bacterium]